MGASYGGYATLSGLTRDPDTYACGVDVSGPSNLEGLGPNQPLFFGAGAMYNNEFGDAKTEAGLAQIRDQSPLNHVDRLKSPLLVVQGANDPAVNRSQADRMVAAAKAKGIPVTYLLYPDEGHGFQRAENNLSSMMVAEQFFAKCLGGRAEPITGNSLQGSSMQALEGADQIAGLEAAIAMRDSSSAKSSLR